MKWITNFELKKIKEKYDVIIAGSDQIWNILCYDSDDAYYLNFIENVKNTENEDTKLLNLQKSLKNGTIKISDLTLSEINKLDKLYVSQNEVLKKKIENHKNRILQLKQQAE